MVYRRRNPNCLPGELDKNIMCQGRFYRSSWHPLGPGDDEVWIETEEEKENREEVEIETETDKENENED